MGTRIEAVYRIKLGGDRGAGSFLLGGFFEGASDVNLEVLGLGEGDPLVFS